MNREHLHGASAVADTNVAACASVDFLCIGAQRSGTTWLAWNLRDHPGIWIPPCKEVHYFSRSTKYPSPSHLECRSLAEKLLGRSQQAQTWRWLFFGYARKWLARANWKEKPAQLAWIYSYFFRKPDDRWYLRLFQRGRGKICGEVSPDYSLLQPEDVARVAALIPKVKVLILLRDPLDRVLSQLRYHMSGKVLPDLTHASEEQIVDFATAPGQIRRGDHVTTLKTWAQFFPEKNIYTAYFEDICARPGSVLSSVHEFVGVGARATGLPANVGCAINSSRHCPIPKRVISRIAQAHEGVVDDCVRVFRGRALRWRDNIHRAIHA